MQVRAVADVDSNANNADIAASRKLDVALPMAGLQRYNCSQCAQTRATRQAVHDNITRLSSSDPQAFLCCVCPCMLAVPPVPPLKHSSPVRSKTACGGVCATDRQANNTHVLKVVHWRPRLRFCCSRLGSPNPESCGALTGACTGLCS